MKFPIRLFNQCRCICNKIPHRGITMVTSEAMKRAVKLSYASYQSIHKVNDGSPMIIIHGMFGSKKNWESLAKAFSRSGRKIITVDCRNHGESPHRLEMDFPIMCEDVHLLMNDLNIEEAVLLGHSMGGKVAMTMALRKPELVSKLIVLDVAPDTSRTPGLTSFPSYIGAMAKVRFDQSMENVTDVRRDVGHQIEHMFPDKSIRDFLLTNIELRDDVYQWRVNIQSIWKNLDKLVGFPHFHGSYHGDTLFLGGSESTHITDKHVGEIKRLFPESSIEHIEGAGHWVHADKPYEFMDAVEKFLLVTS